MMRSGNDLLRIRRTRTLRGLAFIFCICPLLGGCAAVNTPKPVLQTVVATSASFAGHVHGGQQPVSHALIGMYAAGTNGPGSASTSLLTQTVYTDSKGDFNLNGLYSCPTPGTQVFLTAGGGYPGTGLPAANPGIGLIALLGPCGNITDQTFVNMNEVTTVAAVWSMASMMNSAIDIGSEANDPLFADAVARSQQLANTATGTSPGLVVVPGYTAPASKVNNLADILASCINTLGGVAGDGSACGSLYAAATPPGGAPPTDTVVAALRIAQNPTRNVQLLYDQVTPAAPFQPVLSSVPADWTLSMALIPAPPIITTAAGTLSPGQTVSIAEVTTGAIVHYTLDGSAPTSASTVYISPLSISSATTISAIADVNGILSSVAVAQVAAATLVPAKLAFVQPPPTFAAGVWLVPAPAVEVLDASGALCTGSSATVSLTGLVNLSGTLRQTASAGIAIFPNLSFSSVGVYTLTAASTGLTSITAPVTITAPPATGEQAVSAATLADTMGINIHLSYTTTLYGTNFPLILSALQDLRIHHVRDGLIDFGTGSSYYYTEYQQLAASGIRADYITSVGQSEALMKAYPARVSGMEALEAPNEYDTSGDPNWAATLRTFLPVLQDAVHGLNPMNGVTLYGPSLVNLNWPSATGNSYAQLGTVSKYLDAGNLHNYPGGRNPGTAGWTPQGYGSIPFAISTSRQSWPTEPVVTTETGYWDDPLMNQSVPDATIGRYAPRILLEQYLQGVSRTYLYELVDDPFSGGSYGLLHADGTPKPAYTALQGLMHLIDDSGSTYTVGRLPWTLSGGAADLHHLLIAKRDGTFLIALWVEEPAYDVNAKTASVVPTERATLQFATPLNVLGVHTWATSGTVSTSAPSGLQKTITLPISDLLTLVEVHR